MVSSPRVLRPPSTLRSSSAPSVLSISSSSRIGTPFFSRCSTPLTMSWRQTGQTGANTIPLGSRRRGGGGGGGFGGDDGGPPGELPPIEMIATSTIDLKRGRSPERKEPELNPDGTKKRRKRNRWGEAADNKAAGLMNLPTAITAPMTAEQLDAYVTHLRIEEISQKLRINDVVPADGDR